MMAIKFLACVSESSTRPWQVQPTDSDKFIGIETGRLAAFKYHRIATLVKRRLSPSRLYRDCRREKIASRRVHPAGTCPAARSIRDSESACAIVAAPSEPRPYGEWPSAGGPLPHGRGS